MAESIKHIIEIFTKFFNGIFTKICDGIFIKFFDVIFTKICDIIKELSNNTIFVRLINAFLVLIIVYFFKKIANRIRQKVTPIHIEGATVINKQFLKKIRRFALKQKYKPEDFYLAKQYENCQWYGILNNWDVKRNAFKKIIDELKNSFTDEFRQPKIIALILGRGGSGKSTLLRRVAVDSVRNDFCILWINDKEISKFYEKGINNLGNYSKIKFLILIEDWYRIKQNTAHSKEIIDSLCNYSNVRILIGDRTLDNSVSREHIFNPDENIIELKVNENKKTIAKIIKKVPHWKGTSESLLTSENDYNSTLYLILWVIARTNQDKNGIIEKSTIKKEGLSGHFQTIVESDLRIIAKHFVGFAKALYYYGSIYSEHRNYFGLNTFLNIADEFDEKKIDNKLAFTSKEIKPILNIYINTTKGLFKSAGDLSLVTFNHDILTDEGLYKAQIAEWHRFDESIALRILPIIINNGDGFSASNYFLITLNKIDFEYFPNADRLKYFNTLISDKKNRGHYLNALFNGRIEISITDKVNYITTILNDFLNFDFSTLVICKCLNHIKNHAAAKKAATGILSQKEFFKLPDSIVSTAMKISKDDAELKKAATNILSQKEFFKLPHQIVSLAIRISKDDAERKKAATGILSQKEFFKLPDSIVSTAMKISKDDAELKKAATNILSQKDFFKLPNSIVSTAMKISKDDAERKKAATDILSQKEFFKLPDSIVSTAMNISKDDAERKKAATDILSQKEFFKLPHQIVSTAMRISKDEKAATDILSQKEFFKLPFEIVSTAMKISKDDAERKKAATEILSQKEFFKLPHQIVSTAMRISKDEKAATDILSQKEFFKLPDSIVSTAMNISKDDAERKKAATEILSQKDFFKLPHSIVSTAMRISKDEKAATDILSQKEFFKLPFEIVSTAMRISKDVSKAEYFLNRWQETNWSIVYQSLSCFSEKTDYPPFIEDIVKKIIVSKSKSGEFYFKYKQLLKIPFHGIAMWEKNCNNIIRIYSNNRNATLLNSVLFSHRSHPKKIRNVCVSVLENWKKEILKPIKQLNREMHFGDNIKIALGHPDLKKLAKKTAQEILVEESKNPKSIREYLLETVNLIINDEKYPEWTLNNDDKLIE